MVPARSSLGAILVLAGCDALGSDDDDGDGIWSLSFYDVLLGRLDERTWTLHPGTP